MLFINSENQVYSGDRQGDDRALTSVEMAIFESEQERIAVNQQITAEIISLEQKQDRAIRELFLYKSDEAQLRLQEIEQQINTLRQQIKD